MVLDTILNSINRIGGVVAAHLARHVEEQFCVVDHFFVVLVATYLHRNGDHILDRVEGVLKLAVVLLELDDLLKVRQGRIWIRNSKALTLVKVVLNLNIRVIVVSLWLVVVAPAFIVVALVPLHFILVVCHFEKVCSAKEKESA